MFLRDSSPFWRSVSFWHATDADHVVAISPIVSRERSTALAALIGTLWGTGHTLTILAVGTAIIIFSSLPVSVTGTEVSLSVLWVLNGCRRNKAWVVDC
jgi:high-affinity nickel permease